MPRFVIDQENLGGHGRVTTATAMMRRLLIAGLLVWTSTPALIAETHRFVPNGSTTRSPARTRRRCASNRASG